MVETRKELTMQIPEALEGKVTIDVQTAAALLGIGRSAAYSAANDGTLPVLRIGGRIVVKVAPFLQMLGYESE